ncbi:MAG: ribose 5-phosphate isomerase B [Deltaproteobacteria bacterium]|uniref:Ribose 5-phosphate isomerase B n=1 Tax=Candidatus Zymogenus saltonus TaxID=2844893 RepID=A0A9D8PQ10_9DELT|nr:ribose 5-phosphate isomerase B [Candidatus Zymogenus saltonus]
MKVAVGSDHGGLDLKTIIVEELKKSGIEVLDVGTNSTESSDYPDFAKKAVGLILKGEAELGVLICGTGIGMSIAANRYKGIRAAVAWNEFMAKMARNHNDANILVLGGRVTGFELAKEILKVFLKESFDGGRHKRRIDKIDSIILK